MDSLAGLSEQALEEPLSSECGFLEPLHSRNEDARGPTPLHLLITNAGGRWTAGLSHLSELVFIPDNPGFPPSQELGHWI